MNLLDKVADNPFICGVELAFNGKLLPSDIPDWQPFANSKVSGADFYNTHIGLASVTFNEESSTGSGGTMYKQVVVFRFPATDAYRSQRIDLMNKVKFLKLKLTNGKDIVVGRNDVAQNARPVIQVKSNIKTAEVQFETVSIFSAGFVPNPNNYGLPSFLPLTLY